VNVYFDITDAEACAQLRQFYSTFRARSRAVERYVRDAIRNGEFKPVRPYIPVQREEEERFPSFDPRRDGAPDPGHYEPERMYRWNVKGIPRHVDHQRRRTRRREARRQNGNLWSDGRRQNILARDA
jgi:hypothetical protein